MLTQISQSNIHIAIATKQSRFIAKALPGVWGTGEKDIYFRGTRQNFEGNRGTLKTILGNREHKKTYFDFWGTVEQAKLFQGNNGTGTLGGPHSYGFPFNCTTVVSGLGTQ